MIDKEHSELKAQLRDTARRISHTVHASKFANPVEDSVEADTPVDTTEDEEEV